MAITYVENELIAVNAVSGTIIADNAITAVHIAQNAVTATQIPAGSITTGQLAADAVSGAKLADSSIVTANIQDDQVTGDKLTDNITIAGTLGVTGVTTLATHLVMGDSDIIKLGAGSDLQIYHNGTHSYISDQGTGDLKILASKIEILSPDAGENIAVFQDDGSIKLFYDNSLKLETVTGGINITGDTDTDTLTVSGNATVGGTLGVTGVLTANAGVVVDNITIDGTTIALSSSNLTLDSAGAVNLDAGDGEIIHKAAGTTFAKILNNSGEVKFQTATQDKDILFQGMDGNTTLFTALTLDMSEAGKAIFTGAATIGGTLGVTGLTTLTGNLTMMSNTLYANQAYVHDRVGHLNDADTYIDFGVDTITFAAGGERMRIASAGQLGIGGANYGTDGQVLTSTGASSAPAWEDAGGGLPSGMTFSDGRNLGIGVTPEANWANDDNAIQVGGLGAVWGKTDQAANKHTTFSNNVYDDPSGGDSYIVSDCASKITLVDDHMAFYVSPDGTADATIGWMEIARITNYSPGGGNMCVGTTASIGASNGKFFVNNGGGTGIVSNTTGGSPLALWRRDSGASTAQVYITFWTSSGGDGGSIKTNDSGQLTVNQASDYRIKENVVSIGSATEKIKQLNPIKFNIIGFPELPREGFLAHEVQEIVPQAVHGEKDGVDEDGEIINQEICTTELIPIMVKTIQELEARIATLEG